jgi:hypothetical protein
MGNVKKPCGAHPIASVLIFLDLLKCYGKSISQQRLRHILSPARIPYTLPDPGINVSYQLSAFHVAHPRSAPLHTSCAKGLGATSSLVKLRLRGSTEH